MAEPAVSPQSDRDLASIAEARALARRAKQAWLELAEFDQTRIDAIVDAMAAAATATTTRPDPLFSRRFIRLPLFLRLLCGGSMAQTRPSAHMG